MIEGMSPIPPQGAADYDPSKKAREDAKLKEAVQQFEQVFLKQLFSEMRKSVPKTNLMGEGKEQEMFEGMLDDERAKAWSQSGGIGLADMMYQQMKKQNEGKS
ncbi:MAG: flagellar biosynthesis protein FlgJ [Armatimonadetes bacterium]|nr:flagellar biosynthesis protein FlgJ [Armatimonadota bacterium]